MLKDASLNTDGEGSLTINASYGDAVIGLSENNTDSKAGAITTNGGRITGIGGNYGHGIGVAYYNSGYANTDYADQIEITGGTVYGSGGYKTAYLGGITSQNCNLVITDGSVRMDNLYTDSTSYTFTQPTNGGSTKVYPFVIQLGSGNTLSADALVTALSVTDGDGNRYTYGINDMYTDEAGKLYLWLPAGEKNFTVMGQLLQRAAAPGYAGGSDVYAPVRGWEPREF